MINFASIAGGDLNRKRDFSYFVVKDVVMLKTIKNIMNYAKKAREGKNLSRNFVQK